MNKKLIASLLSVSMAAGAGVQTPVQLMASTVPVTKLSTTNVFNEQVVETQNITSSVFSPIKNVHYTEYEKAFKVTGIKSYTNNGGQYGSSALKYAFDGDIGTHWETGKQNTNEYKNEVTVTFDNIETINRIAYAPRPGNKGHVQKMSIYASLTEEGEDFQLVATGQTEVRSNVSEFRFQNTQFKRLKFVFEQANQDWAAAGEFMFFKEDIVADKMATLFTDATNSQVSEAFSSIEKLDALEKEAQAHPFYETEYKENIVNARRLLENKEVQYTEAQVTKLTLSEDILKAYDEVYRLQADEIKGITNNGGSYAENAIERAIDGRLDTKWHSNVKNSESFTNEVVIELNELTTLNRLVYAAPRGSNRGFPEEFEIYASRTSKGNTFELVSTGKAQVTQDLIEIKFNPTEFKRLKFVFKKGYEDWACSSEIRLYREDAVQDAMKKLFTNGLMMKVSSEYNSIDAINKLEEQVNSHPLKESYLEDIKLAKEIVYNKDLFKDTRVVTGEQRGRYKEESEKRSINGYAYTSLESIGKYVTPGEEIVVYVDADATGVLPKLCYGQVGRGKGDWRRWADLKPGRNVITAPTNINPSALYLFNDAKPSDQAYAPRVRVEGGTDFPLYIHGETDPQAFFEEVKAYAQKVEYSDDAFVNGNPEGKVFNIAEFVSKNVVITTSAKGAVAGMTEAYSKGYDMADTMDGWEELYDMFQTFMGFEKNATEEKHSYFPNKFISRAFQGVPLGFADHGYTGYLGSDNAERDGGFFKLLAMPPQMPGNDNWAYGHEFGHIFNTKYMVHGEVINNLYPQEYRRIKGIDGDRCNWNGLMKRFQGETVNLGFWENLGILSQLNIAYGYDTYAKVSRAVRDNTELIASIQGSELRRLAVAYSLGVGENLLDFFKGWNYTDVTPEMEEAVKHLPKPTRKIEYLHSGAYDYKGNGFSEDIAIKVTSKLDTVAKANKLSFEIDENNQKDLLGYEILKDGKVIGFTKDNSFTVKDVDIQASENYEVVAYAKDLSTAKPVSVNSFAPTLKVQQEKVTLKLGETFNPVDYIKGSNYKGDNITAQVNITHNVDTTNKGTYEVKYTLLDQGVTVEKVVQVEVVSDYEYLSDYQWQSVETEWSTPRRNTNIKSTVNGEVKVFEKGFGIHANGKIVYDLSNMKHDRFEALVGIDRSIPEQANSSVIFKIIGDGQVLATTKVMRYGEDMVYIDVPIKGVSELVIEIDDANNSISSDHAIIANPKLTTNNVLPTLDVEELTYINLNSKFDTMADVVANDVEDGNILEKVQVETNGFNTGKTGKYNLSYTVADSDGNTVTKERTIVVYSEVDYLSDRNWENARTDYGSVNKDKSSSGAPIKLGVKRETITFAKGVGTHANSEIVYDLSKLSGPVFFETYVGVDRNIEEQNRSSIIFKILGDGKELYNSGLMKRSDDAKHVKLDLTGISKLELIVDKNGSDNAFDHANFGDAKFLVLDAVPTLEIPKDEAVKVGEHLEDIYGTYSATDAEDGDLTSKVEVMGTVNFKQPGHYTITYRVTDNDGNEVIKTRTIAVVDMEDFTYLSDYNWDSASCGWGSIKKDLSPSDNIIRLTDANGQEVQFKKGLGTHARSVLKYDLTNKQAEYFSAYVGVDRGMYGSIGSVAFEVWLDGEKVERTDVIYSRDPMKYIEVNIAGAKELMLVATDGGNGNGSDHAVWGDAKLHYANENNIKVDTEILVQLIEEVKGLNQDNYTKESWNVLVQVKNEALELLASKVTQIEVDNMVNKLLVAKEGLVNIGNKTTLETLVASINNLEVHIYTQTSWQALLSQVEAAKEVLTIEEPSEQVINEAVEKLQGKIEQLEISKGKAGLYELLKVANTMKKSNYSKEADWATFEEMTAYYNELYWAPTVHSEEMYELVLEYYSWLIQDIESHKITIDYKKALENLITSTKDLEAHIYTQASWESLLGEIEAAKKVLNLEEPSEEIINEAVQKLQGKIEQLEISKGKAGLYELLKVANAMEKSNYSAEADWTTFEEMTAYYNELYWAPTVHPESMYELVLEYYDGLIKSIEVHRLSNDNMEQLEENQVDEDALLVEQSQMNQPEVGQVEEIQAYEGQLAEDQLEEGQQVVDQTPVEELER